MKLERFLNETAPTVYYLIEQGAYFFSGVLVFILSLILFLVLNTAYIIQKPGNGYGAENTFSIFINQGIPLHLLFISILLGGITIYFIYYLRIRVDFSDDF